jgi:phosphoribosylaminoimidazole-succinocarboxamide synthase
MVPMAHFDIPLDIPHAGRLADRILNLLEKHTQELAVDAPEVLETAEEMSNLLFRYSANDENPIGAQAEAVRQQAADLGRQLVDQLEAARIAGDRLGQFIRNYFECLELGEEGARVSLRAGENPKSLQRPT